MRLKASGIIEIPYAHFLDSRLKVLTLTIESFDVAINFKIDFEGH